MEADQTMVRMGELAVSARRGHQLVALGLGSCIGLALLDRRLGTAGLAHVVLPQAPRGERSLKFADRAVPELVSRLAALGGRRIRLEAVLVGGASMFAASPALEVGSRNEAAVREQLAALRIPVLASATGGSRGRTVRIDVATTTVSVRETGGHDAELVAPTRAIEVAA
jgi:chemotaxis protein CheD